MFGKNKMKELQRQIDDLDVRNSFLSERNEELKRELEKEKSKKKCWDFAIPRTAFGDDNSAFDAVKLANVVNYLTSENLTDEEINWDYKREVILVTYRSERELTAKLAKIAYA